MRIGVDIDNVISDFSHGLLEAYIEHDKELRNTGIVNEEAEFIRYGMFDWSKEEEEFFYKTNIEKIAMNLKPINNAKKYIDKLIDDGNEVYIITGRDNGEYTDHKKMTKDWLLKYDINYHKLIFTNAYDKKAKAEVCVQNDVKVMIEDSYNTCKYIEKKGIKTLFMNTRFNKNHDDLERVFSWQEIYYKIANMQIN